MNVHNKDVRNKEFQLKTVNLADERIISFSVIYSLLIETFSNIILVHYDKRYASLYIHKKSRCMFRGRLYETLQSSGIYIQYVKYS